MARKILVVDDEKDIVEIYRKALTAAGYEPICAYNGEEGLNILRANPNIDLVVLDLKMPKMTGDKFLKVIRGDPLLKDTKVLVMSSVLYRYKEIPRYDPTVGRVVGYRIVQKGLTKIGKRAEDTRKPGEKTLEMQEKPKARVEFNQLFGYMPEDEAVFERNISKDLIKKVKEIFGEPYDKEASEDKHREVTAIETKTRDIIAKYLKVDKKLTSPSTSFPKDLGVAFIDAIPLRRRLEKEFKVKISWQDQENIETVGDLVRCIEYTKMYARTKKERFRKADREFWEFWRPYLIAVAVALCFGLALFILEMIKSHTR